MSGRAERPAPAPGPVPAPVPVPVPPQNVRLAFWILLTAAALSAVGAAATLLTGLFQARVLPALDGLGANSPAQDSLGLAVLGGVLLALAGLGTFYTFRVRRGSRGARDTLTTFALMVAVVCLFRRTALLWLPAAALVLAVVLLWLPAGNRFFGPKKRRPGGRK